MSETVFRFEVSFGRVGDDTILQTLEEKLVAINGVENVESDVSKTGVYLGIRVSFIDSNDAKKLHRKVMNQIIGHNGVTITQATTNLTDIF